jgi:hypothetical protein
MTGVVTRRLAGVRRNWPRFDGRVRGSTAGAMARRGEASFRIPAVVFRKIHVTEWPSLIWF